MNWFKKILKKDDEKWRNKKVGKRAILIGLNYPGSRFTLKGCHNDVINGGKCLEKNGYYVKVLFDDDVSNRYNVLQALAELGTSSSSNLFFHYSGHGTQKWDQDGDEEDGCDEVVYSKNGVEITDDQINSAISLFPKEKMLVLVFDCCHSGSITDLPYIYTQNDGVKTEKIKKEVQAKVICISGARDIETAADVVKNGVGFGALSSTFYPLLEKHKGKGTWKQLYSDLVLEMKKQKYTQYPILSASDPSLFYEKIDALL